MMLRALERYGKRSTRRARAAEAASCELCALPIGEEHRHVVDLVQRSIGCACPACALLFADPAAGRYRTIPDRVLVVPERRIGEALWSAIGVPVRLAFFFRLTNDAGSASGWRACYPSAAGATDAEPEPDAWARFLAESALAREVQPDVEALLVRSPRGQVGLDAYLVPIDACYRLVGLVRSAWSGIGGGDVHDAVADFFADLDARSRPLRTAGGRGGAP